MHLPFVFVSERPEPESALFRRMPVAVPESAAFPHWIIPAWQLFFAAVMLLRPHLIESDAHLILPFRNLTAVLRKQAGYNRQKSLHIPAGTARPHSFFAHLTGGFRPEVAASHLPAGFFHHPIPLSHLRFSHLHPQTEYLLPYAQLPMLQQHRKQLHRNGPAPVFL